MTAFAATFHSTWLRSCPALDRCEAHRTKAAPKCIRQHERRVRVEATRSDADRQVRIIDPATSTVLELAEAIDDPSESNQGRRHAATPSSTAREAATIDDGATRKQPANSLSKSEARMPNASPIRRSGSGVPCAVAALILRRAGLAPGPHGGDAPTRYAGNPLKEWPLNPALPLMKRPP